jgi:hypothetical protein
VAHLYAADICLTILSDPANLLVTGWIIRGQQHAIILLESAILVRFIVGRKITDAARDWVLVIRYVYLEIDIVLVCAGRILACRLQIILSPDYLAVLVPLLERPHRMVQRQHSHAAIQELDKVLPSVG